MVAQNSANEGGDDQKGWGSLRCSWIGGVHRMGSRWRSWCVGTRFISMRRALRESLGSLEVGEVVWIDFGIVVGGWTTASWWLGRFWKYFGFLVYGFRLRVGLGARARDLDRSPKAAQHRLNWSPSLTETCDGQLEFRSVTMVTNLWGFGTRCLGSDL